ncbi:MAG: HNH endonuclease [Vicinamibacteria bacterium]|nr:HNH endonuclease [Vicinamibacteria bacterium]
MRPRVLQLIPIHRALRRLGVSYFPDASDGAARDRILQYFQRYPQTVINGKELMIVAGIQEWARRLRELRVEFGWKIMSGKMLAELSAESAKAGEPEPPPFPGVKPTDYVLVDKVQDKETATRWREANSIRKRKDLAVADRILALLKLNVGKQVTGEELRNVAGPREWTRRVRELRTDYGWPISTKPTGRPDLPIGVYVLESLNQAPEHDRKIPDPVRRKVLLRDGHKCSRCGWSHGSWNASDPRNLEVHHVEHHAQGGSNLEENLLTLCNICHDEEHRLHRRR